MPVWYWPGLAVEVGVRILVTNDDGVRAPGIAALTRAAARTGHEVVVVAPLVDYSGAGAAVGPVHSRDGVDYERHQIDGVAEVPVFGIDGPPALAVILAGVGGFGAPPDLVLSGINHGANVGRSVMHSGTVGAALTAAHFGARALAVSIRWGEEPVPWDTAATLAAALVPLLADAPASTVLNLNVPDVPLTALRGIRMAGLGRAGTIRSAVHADAMAEDTHPHVSLPAGDSGTLRLDLAPPWTDAGDDLSTDADLIANDHAALTALVGVRPSSVPGVDEITARALDLLRRAAAPGDGSTGDPPAGAARAG